MALALTIAQILSRIVDADGNGFTVGPRFFPRIEDAERTRLKLAHRLARATDAARNEFLLLMRLHHADELCAFCCCPTQAIGHCTVVGAKWLHKGCAEQWATWLDKSARETQYEVTPKGTAARAERGVA